MQPSTIRNSYDPHELAWAVVHRNNIGLRINLSPMLAFEKAD